MQPVCRKKAVQKGNLDKIYITNVFDKFISGSCEVLISSRNCVAIECLIIIQYLDYQF
jgi:hypothetical protein